MPVLTAASRGSSWPERFRSWAWKAQRPFRATLTFPTRQGRFSVDARDAGIGKQLYCQRQFEWELISETLDLTRRLGLVPAKGEGTLLDIGANIGVISVGMLATGEMARAVAIEPAPGNFELLERNVAQNGLDTRMVRVRAAVAETVGELEFELSASNFGDHRVRSATGATGKPGAKDRYDEASRRSIRVRSARLDDLLDEAPAEFRDSISLTWIDVQGFEAAALRGGSRAFERRAPLMAEIWPYGLARAGTTTADFCQLVQRFWRHYWVRRRRGYVRYPIETLGCLFDELGEDGGYDNALFT